MEAANAELESELHQTAAGLTGSEAELEQLRAERESLTSESSIEIPPSQSRLLTIVAAPEPGSKSRNRSSWARMPATFTASVSRSSRFRSADVPDGSPISRSPRHHQHRSAAVPLEVEQPEDRHEMAQVERRPGRVHPVVGGQRPTRREARLEPGVRSCRSPRQASSSSSVSSLWVGARVTGGAGDTSRRGPSPREKGLHSTYAIFRPDEYQL